MEKETKYKDQTIIFFDDDCLMCNGFVRKIVKLKSKKNRIYFASLGHLTISDEKVKIPKDTIILYYSGIFYFKSTAVLKILLLTKVPTKFLGLLIVVPVFLRDFIYDKIANNRYIFGKKTYCEMPDKAFSEIIINHNVVI